MKFFVLCAVLVAAVAAAPAGSDADATVVRSEVDNIGVEGFKYSYETSNGISAQEEGVLKNAGSEDASISVRGQFTYTGPDNKVYVVTYVADENGFQPQGEHIPVAP